MVVGSGTHTESIYSLELRMKWKEDSMIWIVLVFTVLCIANVVRSVVVGEWQFELYA